MSDKDYYAILGVLPSIDQAALQAVYRALLKKYHPDVFAGDKLEAERITKELTEAYSVLGDAARRQEYDKNRFASKSKSGDYTRQAEADKGAKGTDEAFSISWQYISQVHPEAETHRRELAEISTSLALAFQALLIETKMFSKIGDIRKSMQKDFFDRFFGRSALLHDAALQAITSKRADVAHELNLAVKFAGGDPAGDNDQKILSAVSKKTGFTFRLFADLEAERDWINKNFPPHGSRSHTNDFNSTANSHSTAFFAEEFLHKSGVLVGFLHRFCVKALKILLVCVVGAAIVNVIYFFYALISF